MNNCYLCDELLTAENRTVEHIILNALGGELKSSELLYRQCNSKLGDGPDAILAKQFEFLSAYLLIRREKGKIPIVKGGKTASGVDIDLVDGSTPRLGRPKFNVETTERGLEYHIVARDEKEMKSLLQGIKKRHPFFDIDKALEVAKTKIQRIKEPVIYQQTFGGDDAFKSIAKTALSFFLHNKGEKKHVEKVVSYVKGKECDIVRYFHSAKQLYKKEAGEVVHLLHIVGDKYHKLLYCYVEFFSSHSYIVILSDDYRGKNLHCTYGYNLITGAEVKKDVKLKLDRLDIENLSSKFSYFDEIKAKADRVMSIATQRQTQREIGNITQRAVDEIFAKKYGHESVISQIMIDEFIERVTIDFVEFMYGE